MNLWWGIRRAGRGSTLFLQMSFDDQSFFGAQAIERERANWLNNILKEAGLWLFRITSP